MAKKVINECGCVEFVCGTANHIKLNAIQKERENVLVERGAGGSEGIRHFEEVDSRVCSCEGVVV